MSSSKRIVLTTFGSLGDLHPYMALALGLRERGHRPVIATTSYYREKIEAEGIEFARVRPDFADKSKVKQLVREVLEMNGGPETVIRRVVLPHLSDSYADLTRAVAGADLLISHTLTYAAPIVAEKLGLKWASSALQPTVLFSLQDEIEWAPAPWLSTVRHIAPPLYRALISLLIHSTDSWVEPIRELRKREGMSASKENPIFLGQHSPHLVLALFSRALCSPMPDWPPKTIVTGFPFYDRNGGPPIQPEIEAFLAAGPPPVVFTLGSSAVMDAGQFYHDSAAAARKLGVRALLLIGDEPENRQADLPPEIAAFAYTPYSEVFPRCAAIVHQGGVGTTGQAMRAGRPMLVMPYGQDQPDNAARMVRLGVGRTIKRVRYTAVTAAAELAPLLNEPTYAAKALEVGKIVQSEDGVTAACNAIEDLMRSSN